MQNSDCPPALVQQMMTADRNLALCLRSDGVPNLLLAVRSPHELWIIYVVAFQRP